LPAGRPEKPAGRKWYPTAENDEFIEGLYAASPEFDQSQFVNMLMTMVRVGLKGSVLDVLSVTPQKNRGQTTAD